MSKPDKAERKERLRALQHDAEVAAELAREREIGEDVHWRGVGERVFQIQQVPSFEGGLVWDIRVVREEFKLYESTINPEKTGFLRPGYKQLAIESSELAAVLSSLSRLKLQPCLSAASAGCDGTTTTVLMSRGFSTAMFSWWEQGPDEWREIIQVVNECIAKFRKLPALQGDA